MNRQRAPRRLTTVLVVDADQPDRALLCRVIGKEYPVLEAAGFEDASHLAHLLAPDMIVAGITAPTAAEATAWIRALRNNPATTNMPVLMLARRAVSAETLTSTITKSETGSNNTSILPWAPHNGCRIREELHRMIGVCPSPRSTLQRERRTRSDAWTEPPPPSWKDRENYGNSVDLAALTRAPITRLIV
jgi:CheY-like chemotaxis protein